jgi:hypothetical protein
VAHREKSADSSGITPPRNDKVTGAATTETKHKEPERV